MIILFLILLPIVHQSLGCQEILHNKTRTGGYSFRYDYSRGRYTSYDTTINNCTILCSNIYSIKEIFYTYRDRPYEQFLKIANSNVTTLHSNELDSFPTIIKLFLSGIGIKEILPGAFTGLLKLQELYLDHNQLGEVSKGVFTSLQKLQVLDLSSNKILTIEKLALMGVSNLKKLQLQDNQISALDDDMFDKLQALTYLDLSDNPLGKVPMRDLSHLDVLLLRNTSLNGLSGQNVTLKMLNLTSSQISSVDFAEFPKSDVVDLSNNRISLIENCEQLQAESVVLRSNRIRSIDGGFGKVKHLSLVDNQLEKINSSLLNRTKSIFFLNLGNNSISSIEADAFRNLTELYYLGLNNNNISKIDPSLFRDLTSLYYLVLSYNNITEFQYGTFNNLKSLVFLDISHNKLLNLHPYNVYALTRLQMLYFDYNQVSDFDVEDLTSHLKAIMTISLNGNPWKCKQLIHMSHVLLNMSVAIKEGSSFDVENFKGIPCQNDNHFDTSDENHISEETSRMLQQFRDLLNQTLQNEDVRFGRFFNEEFENSTFVKFFRNFNDSRFSQVEAEQKSVAVEAVPQPIQADLKSEEAHSGNSGILVLSVILQFIICVVLIFGLYLMFSFMRKNKDQRGGDRVSQVELCSDY